MDAIEEGRDTSKESSQLKQDTNEGQQEPKEGQQEPKEGEQGPKEGEQEPKEGQQEPKEGQQEEEPREGQQEPKEGENKGVADKAENKEVAKEGSKEKEGVAGDKLAKLEAWPARRLRTRTISRAVYETTDGKPLDKDIISNIKQFQDGKKKGFIDVWWLYDDGGLTLLIPYILSTRQMYSECSLRVFCLGNKKDDLDRETRNMAALLAKFRIDFSDVVVIPDVTKRAEEATRTEFNSIIDKLPAGHLGFSISQSLYKPRSTFLFYFFSSLSLSISLSHLISRGAHSYFFFYFFLSLSVSVSVYLSVTLNKPRSKFLLYFYFFSSVSVSVSVYLSVTLNKPRSTFLLYFYFFSSVSVSVSVTHQSFLPPLSVIMMCW